MGKLIIPRRKNGKSPEGSFDGFVVFNVASDAITPTYQIRHASSHDIFHGCWYGASMPPPELRLQVKVDDHPVAFGHQHRPGERRGAVEREPGRGLERHGLQILLGLVGGNVEPNSIRSVVT